MRVKKSCKVDDCSNLHFARDFCRRHYGDWFHKRRDEEGNAINGYVPKFPHCQYPQCKTKGTKKSSLRNGLCNKHRKWAEKGIINRETFEIIDLVRIPKPKHEGCKMPRCERKHKAHGFCINHYRSYFIYKTLDINGNRTGKRKFYTENSSCKLAGCINIGKLVKGFCKPHYESYRKGFYTFNGVRLKDLKKVYKYPEGATCKAEGCQSRPESNWFCYSCFKKIQSGSLDNTGRKTSKHQFINIGKKCSDKSCTNNAKIKGMCPKHYRRTNPSYQGPEAYKNVGKSCTKPNCSEPAVCRTMCDTHYRIALGHEQRLALLRSTAVHSTVKLK